MKKKNLGKVVISMGYVVDLDNQTMVEEAKVCLLEDINDAFKYNELQDHIEIIKDSKAKESDIPEFLQKD
jgi:hypothetical protein